MKRFICVCARIDQILMPHAKLLLQILDGDTEVGCFEVFIGTHH